MNLDKVKKLSMITSKKANNLEQSMINSEKNMNVNVEALDKLNKQQTLHKEAVDKLIIEHDKAIHTVETKLTDQENFMNV